MADRHKLLSRLAGDLGGAVIGLIVGAIYVAKFGGGFGQPLNTTDSLIVICSIFTFLLMSVVFQKVIGDSKDQSSKPTCY